MDATFLNFENSKISQTPRLLINLANKINLKRSDKYVAFSNHSMCYMSKNKKIIQKQ